MKRLNLDFEKLKVFGFYVLLLLLCIASVLRTNNYDYDLWARLIAGMYVVQTGHVAKYDFLSFTPTHNWYDHEWGSGTIFYLLQHNFGHIGLLLLQVVLVFFTMFFLIKAVKVRCLKEYNYRNILIYFMVLDAFMVTYSAVVRCHSFTFMFFIFELFLLEYVRTSKNYKWLYILPVIFLIWTNLHGGVVSGLGLLAIYTFGQILEKNPFKHYLILTCICPLMLFVNPYGIDYVKFLMHATTMPRPDISEWWPIFNKINWKFFKSFKIMTAFILSVELMKLIKTGFNYKNLDKTKFIILSVTLYIAVIHAKMMPFFILCAVVYCYNDVCNLFKNIRFPKWGMPFLTIFLVFYSLIMICFKNFETMVDFKRYPLLEVEFIKKNHITGNILTNFGFGSFVSYKLYPHNKVYMDGRYEEVYDDYILAELRDFYTLKNDPLKILEKYPIDIILLEKYYGTYNLIKNLEDWTLVFEGTNFGVFVKKGKINKNSLVDPNNKLEFYQKTIFNTDINFYGNKVIGQVKN